MREGVVQVRGASVANGQSTAYGPVWLSWRGGFQAPRPVSFWDFVEGEEPR